MKHRLKKRRFVSWDTIFDKSGELRLFESTILSGTTICLSLWTDAASNDLNYLHGDILAYIKIIEE